MAERFILGSLRAPFDAVEEEIDAFEKELFVDSPDDSICLGRLLLIPVDKAWPPDHLRERYKQSLDAGLFENYVIGTICGPAYGAIDTEWVQTLKDGRKFIYGTEGHLVEMVRSLGDGDGAWTIIGAGEIADDRGELRGHRKACGSAVEGVVAGERCEVPSASWSTAHFGNWTKRSHSGIGSPPPTGPKLLVVVYREERTQRDSDALRDAAGHTAAIVMSGEFWLVMAVRSSDSPKQLFQRVRHRIPPRFVEDFVIFNIDEQVASMHTELSPLSHWLERSAADGYGVEPDELFALPRSRGRRA